jgi:NodT family efflux transporter outer membrane factor (OMF) lipoprotein
MSQGDRENRRSRENSAHLVTLSLLRGLLILLFAGGVGCTSMREYIHNGFKVGPNYSTPPAPVARDWIDADDRRVREQCDDLRQWWTVFDDPVLNQLIDVAYRQNLTLREAGMRILQARAQRGIAVGQLFPQTQFAAGDYQRLANSIETATSQGIGPRTRFFSQWDLDFHMTWELDFWGRFRRAIETADANLEASVAEYDDVLVTLLSDVAANYVQMRVAQQRIEYALENVDLQAVTRQNARTLREGGVVTELDEDQALTLLRQTEAAIPELEISVRVFTNRLCILLGMPPEKLPITDRPSKSARAAIGSQAESWPGIPRVHDPERLAFGIPADLLRRRPDVRRAERLAAAQSAQIGVAESAMYPHISLTGTLSYSAAHFKNLFSPTALNGNFGPTYQWDLLNYGRIMNNVRLQDARFQELLTTYQNTVLNAQLEVENGLVTFKKAQDRTRLQGESVHYAIKAAEVVHTRYRGGGENFTRVTQTQQLRLQAQDLLAQSQGEIALGLIEVYRALGGGWQIRCAEPHSPSFTAVPPNPP